MPTGFYIGCAVILVLQLVAIAALSWRALERKTQGEPIPQAAVQMESRLAALELTVAGLPSLWESERSRAEAAANSARTARARAERLTREREAELEADHNVRGDDAEESGGGRMPAVRQDLGPHPQPDGYSRALIENSLHALRAI